MRLREWLRQMLRGGASGPELTANLAQQQRQLKVEVETTHRYAEGLRRFEERRWQRERGSQ